MVWIYSTLTTLRQFFLTEHESKDSLKNELFQTKLISSYSIAGPEVRVEAVDVVSLSILTLMQHSHKQGSQI